MLWLAIRTSSRTHFLRVIDTNPLVSPRELFLNNPTYLTDLIDIVSNPYAKDASPAATNPTEAAEAWAMWDELSEKALLQIFKNFMSRTQQAKAFSSSHFIDALAHIKQLDTAIAGLIINLSPTLRFNMLTSPGVRAAFTRHAPHEVENLMEGMMPSQKQTIRETAEAPAARQGDQIPVTSARPGVLGL
jgi:hypothetical protein